MTLPLVSVTDRDNGLSIFNFLGLLNLNSASSLHPVKRRQATHAMDKTLYDMYCFLIFKTFKDK